MNRTQVAAVVEAALDRLVERQPELLALDVTERALSHHLALYISQLVPNGLDVDVELAIPRSLLRGSSFEFKNQLRG